MIEHEQKFLWQGDGEDIEIVYRPEWDFVDFKWGDKSRRVPVEDIWSLAFVISREDKQERLIPVKTQEVRIFNKRVKLKLKKPMEAGEEVVADVKFTVPLELLVKQSGGLWVPIKS